MTFTTLILPLILLSTTLTAAQVTYNPTAQTFTCPTTGGTFCLASSLSSAVIIRCTGTVGVEGNCNDDLKGLPPQGTKLTAACYQSSPLSGTAACSFQGTVYPDAGEPFPLFTSTTTSTTISSSSTSSSSTSSSSSSTSTSSISSTNPPSTNPTTPTSSSTKPTTSTLPNLAVAATATATFSPSSGAIGMGTLTVSTASSTGGAAGARARGTQRARVLGLGVGVGVLGVWVGW